MKQTFGLGFGGKHGAASRWFQELSVRAKLLPLTYLSICRRIDSTAMCEATSPAAAPHAVTDDQHRAFVADRDLAWFEEVRFTARQVDDDEVVLVVLTNGPTSVAPTMRTLMVGFRPTSLVLWLVPEHLFAQSQDVAGHDIAITA